MQGAGSIPGWGGGGGDVSEDPTQAWRGLASRPGSASPPGISPAPKWFRRMRIGVLSTHLWRLEPRGQRGHRTHPEGAGHGTASRPRGQVAWRSLKMRKSPVAGRRRIVAAPRLLTQGLLPVHGPNDNKGPSLSTWLQTRRGNSFSQLPMTFQLLVLSSGSQLDSPWVPLPVLQSGQLVKAAHWAEVHRHRHAVRHSVAITPNRSLGPCVASAFPKHH